MLYPHKISRVHVAIVRGMLTEYVRTEAYELGRDNEVTFADRVHLSEGAGAFDSGTLAPEATVRHTFALPGTDRYVCIPHEGAKMYGTVIVKE